MKPLAEQVAELERERDRLKDVAVELEQKRSEMQRRLWVQEGYTHDERQRAERAEASLASAKVEGAREALTRYAEKSFDFAHMFRFRDREYPASGEGRRAECGVCKDAREVPVRGWPNSYSECPKCRPTPPSAPEPLRIVVQSLHSSGALVATPMSVLISPADARRIVSLATSTEASK